MLACGKYAFMSCPLLFLFRLHECNAHYELYTKIQVPVVTTFLCYTFSVSICYNVRMIESELIVSMKNVRLLPIEEQE